MVVWHLITFISSVIIIVSAVVRGWRRLQLRRAIRAEDRAISKAKECLKCDH